MRSTYEGYALILKEYEEVVKTMDRVKTDMSFLWMNTAKENFDDEKAQAHALKETGYLVTALDRLEKQAKKASDLVSIFSMVAGTNPKYRGNTDLP